MTVLTHFFEYGEDLGTMRNKDFIHVSLVLVCPICGIAWGLRAVYENAKLIEYNAKTVPCNKHGNSSIITPFDNIEKLPEYVLRREILYNVA